MEKKNEKEEWNNFIKKEQFFVLIWGDSNPEQSMKKFFIFQMRSVILENCATEPSLLQGLIQALTAHDKNGVPDQVMLRAVLKKGC